MLAVLGVALAGRAGARLAGRLGLAAGRDALLRAVRAQPDPDPGVLRVLGIDDFALRRGRTYGTVLVDMDTHRVVDLLGDREALAGWLAGHPGVEVVCRDRAGAYAEGARRGAPGTVQVADRWHLWHNLCEAAERCVFGHRRCLRAPGDPLAEPEPDQAAGSGDPDTDPWPTGHRFAERTRRTHAHVQELLAKGHSRRAVGRALGMGPAPSAATPGLVPPRSCSAASGSTAPRAWTLQAPPGPAVG